MPNFKNIPYISQETPQLWEQTMNDDNINIINHLYEDSPNIFIQKYNETYFNCNWCYCLTAEKDFNIGKLFQNPNNFNNISNNATLFNKHWVNNVYYKDVNQNDNWGVVSIFQKVTSINEQIFTDYKIPYVKLKNNDVEVYAVISPLSVTGHILLILYAGGYNNDINDRTNLTFASIAELVKSFHNDNHNHNHNTITTLLSKLHTVLSSVKSPDILKFNKSIYVMPSPSPNIHSRENEYYKNDSANPNPYVIRYSGDITPTFIDIQDTPNYLYIKDQVTSRSFEGSKYYQYIKSGYIPIFPSLKYTSILGNTLSYTKPPKYTIFNEEQSIVDPHEYSWFNNSQSLILPPEITVDTEVDAKDDTQVVLKKAIIDNIIKLYNISSDNTDLQEYIYNQYDIKYSYDYKDPYNMPNVGDGVDSKYDYIYHINLMLK